MFHCYSVFYFPWKWISLTWTSPVWDCLQAKMYVVEWITWAERGQRGRVICWEHLDNISKSCCHGIYLQSSTMVQHWQLKIVLSIGCKCENTYLYIERGEYTYIHFLQSAECNQLLLSQSFYYCGKQRIHVLNFVLKAVCQCTWKPVPNPGKFPKPIVCIIPKVHICRSSRKEIILEAFPSIKGFDS